MDAQEPGGAAGAPAGASHSLHADAAASRLPAELPAPPPLEVQQQEAKFQEARKAMIKVVNWQLNDYKHRKLEQILDTTQYLQKICGNVRDHPEEPKYRKIRITNNTFQRHVRDAPGGEEFMHTAGWGVKVIDYEKYFLFEHQPGGLEWRVLEEACAELAKLQALVDGKIKRGQGDKKAQQEAMRLQVKAAIEEDKAQREVMFQPVSGDVQAQALPPSPRSRSRGQGAM
ncbi:hypothetical protein ABPG75_007564 [Micractinium tetrahymenae]